MLVRVYDVSHWSRYRFLAGANKYIQQEGVFWRRSLWERAGGYVDASRRFVSDFELWVRFFRHAQLYSVNALIGGYRAHGDALGQQYWDVCDIIQHEIIERELSKPIECGWLNLLRKTELFVRHIPKVRGFWNLYVKPSIAYLLYRVPGPDWPPTVEYQVWKEPHKWMLRRWGRGDGIPQ
jgi:hypothetical protein